MAQPADVHRSCAGLVSLAALPEKGKYLSCPVITENLKEKSEKYSLWVWESNDHSLNNTRLLSVQLQEKGRKEKVFILILESAGESYEVLVN